MAKTEWTYRVRRAVTTGEYMVEAFRNGKRHEGRTYYTDIREDAFGTMKLMEQADRDRALKMPKRYAPWGVGKSIGGCVYIHKDYASVLPRKPYLAAKCYLPKDFPFNLIKFNPKTMDFTFIHAVGWLSIDEPMMSDAWLIKADGTAKLIKRLADPWIYHHKWLMVKDDYEGFDVEASKNRSRAWLALEDVDSSRIGKLSYWIDNVFCRL